MTERQSRHSLGVHTNETRDLVPPWDGRKRIMDLFKDLCLCTGVGGGDRDSVTHTGEAASKSCAAILLGRVVLPHPGQW